MENSDADGDGWVAMQSSKRHSQAVDQVIELVPAAQELHSIRVGSSIGHLYRQLFDDNPDRVIRGSRPRIPGRKGDTVLMSGQRHQRVVRRATRHSRAGALPVGRPGSTSREH
jgi:hypothetical protein